MKKTVYNLTAVLITILAGYWIPFYWMHIVSHKTALLPSAKACYTPFLIKNYPTCDPFSDKNLCILKPSLRTVLKTDAQKYQYIYVLRKLDELQLPQKLALLPIIESQYNPYAISSRGAAGVWQLMPDTARYYGLLNDERFELEASTQAALLFLKELHSQFGSWELAIAAYNAGRKRVQQALEENPSAKHVDQLSLPSATKKYVSHFNYLTLAHQ